MGTGKRMEMDLIFGVLQNYEKYTAKNTNRWRTCHKNLYIRAIIGRYVENLGSTSIVDVFWYVTSVINENKFEYEE